MLVSWSWLKRYVELPTTPADLGHRFAMSGLNLESIEERDGETIIDLEVTSNRGDCLGHLGVAREAAVLLGQTLRKPDPKPVESDASLESLLSIENRYPESCPRYTARVIRGVRVGPSPKWLADALRSVGIGVVNNIVDVTNFVLFECGQPLHAFDYAKVTGKKIVIRPANAGETIEAIDHRTYTLQAGDCVIADSQRAVAVAGVMGGASTEVGSDTTDVLIEVADFAPLSVRRTARRLNLHSPSSFRFERRVDPAGIEWASRRCCELILEVAGGKMAKGFLQSHPVPAPAAAITFRLSQIQRVLGIEIPVAEVERILKALGCSVGGSPGDAAVLRVSTPSWRHDLTREIDLVEEIARIYGYDRIPENAPVPVVASRRRPVDAAMDQLRAVFTSAGFCEAMTPSVVSQPQDAVYSPWSASPPLEALRPMLEGARTLRRSLVPSLLQSRYANQAASGADADLYEAAHVYLPSEKDDGLPQEKNTIAFVTSRDFFGAKGLVETALRRLGIAADLEVKLHQAELLDDDLAVELNVGGTPFGFLGTLSASAQKRLKLDRATTVCELDFDALMRLAKLVPQHQAISPFPAISRDINLILDEPVAWSELSAIVRQAAGPHLVALKYVETYRDANKDGAGKKRVLMNLTLQKPDATLSGAEADQAMQATIARCAEKLGAKLLAS